MTLSIKNKQAEALAHEVAELSGDSITGGVIAALKAHKERLLRQADATQRLRHAHDCLEQEVWSLPNVGTDLTEDEILGYGPSGGAE